MLRITTAPQTALVQGYVFAALYRLRGVFAIMIGITPLLGMDAQKFAWQISSVCSPFNYSRSLYLQSEAVWAPLVIGLWGVTLLATVAAVRVVLWRRRMMSAVLFVALPTALFSAFVVLVLCLALYLISIRWMYASDMSAQVYLFSLAQRLLCSRPILRDGWLTGLIWLAFACAMALGAIRFPFRRTSESALRR